ncbi:glucose 1-dehydrogenase [Chitinophaga terrae (ex Kim and Jung 2007)]|jgi:glucose 1-dehydrogenase|uniref:Glucose 1-dehydrogenase n=1 Tax=Chitinophaga terrae (ex Kim and Jung 2007) TaxID=408074 RepID=A0A1H4F4Z7_9BACT|nr:glucose 1-dehydrogenase [Chitinophaga terrae (ex Kim and Jung 2007)]GEP91999.1 glucose 1-dehydrogenase [Chitinophaga terrae (ex Kim and Jung 2007)]SEA92281.1 glucose 1-dehydrogenase [Chitinophaga terrae (ex Kim and Jung 2007)]
MVLKGKNVLVTGASSGIGKAIALLFGKEGANIIGTYHHGGEEAEEVMKEIATHGVKAVAIGIDVSEEEEVARLFARAVDEFGDLDILVNNAGINGPTVTIENIQTSDWDKVIKTNLYGPFFCCREFLRLKRRNNSFKGSRIINVSSIHEVVNVPEHAHYNASKAALRNFTRSLALEVAATGMTVNNIAPGMILTPINKEVIEDKEKMKKVEATIPMHRGGTPEEVANVALFLASEASSYVTGSTYTVDGALSILGPEA